MENTTVKFVGQDNATNGIVKETECYILNKVFDNLYTIAYVDNNDSNNSKMLMHYDNLEDAVKHFDIITGDNSTVVVKEVVSHEDLASIKEDMTGIWGNGQNTVVTVKGEFSGNLSDQEEITLVFPDGRMNISNCEMEADGDKITIRKKSEELIEVEFIDEKQVLCNNTNTNEKEGIEMKKEFFTNEEAIEVIVGYIKNNLQPDETIDVSDLHNEVFNSNYYIIGTYQAEKALEQYGVFSALGKIQEYEKDSFGEVYTDLSDVEKVASMLWYIIGEQTMVELGLYDLDDPTANTLLAEIENNR